MTTQHLLSRQWIQFGSVAGILANLLFPVLILVPLPDFMEILLASAFGLLFSCIGFAIHHVMKYEQPSILTQIGALFLFVAGFLFNMMITIQLTFKGYWNHYRSQVTEAQDLNLLDWIAKTVDPVHFGLQIAFDFVVGVAMIILSMAMHEHQYFGRLYAISGGVIALSLLIAKCWAFPMTPYEMGLPYIFGPLVSLWFLIVCIRCWKVRNLVVP